MPGKDSGCTVGSEGGFRLEAYTLSNRGRSLRTTARSPPHALPGRQYLPRRCYYRGEVVLASSQYCASALQAI